MRREVIATVSIALLLCGFGLIALLVSHGQTVAAVVVGLADVLLVVGLMAYGSMKVHQ